MPLKVLVTGKSAPRALSLMQAIPGEPVTLFAYDGPSSEAPLQLEAFPAEQHFTVHSSDSPEYVGDLVALCLRCNVDLLVPAGESELAAVARARELFEGVGTQVLIETPDKLDTPSGKRKVARACRHASAEPSWLAVHAHQLKSWLRSVCTGSPPVHLASPPDAQSSPAPGPSPFTGRHGETQQADTQLVAQAAQTPPPGCLRGDSLLLVRRHRRESRPIREPHQTLGLGCRLW